MEGVTPAAVAVSLTRAVAMVPVVAVRLLNQNRTDRIVATVVSRRLVQPILPGHLTRLRVARRSRVPGGARSSDRLGRTSGSRDFLYPSMALHRRPADRADAVAIAPFLTHMTRRFRPLVAKTTAATFSAINWPGRPFHRLGRIWAGGCSGSWCRIGRNGETGGVVPGGCSWSVWDKGDGMPWREMPADRSPECR